MKKVVPGERLRIPAETFNAFVDAARAYRDNQARFSAVPGQALRSSGLVRVRNATGTPRNRFDVVALDGPIITPTENLPSFKNTLAMDGVSLAAGHSGRWAILQEPLAVNAIGWAMVSGITAARVDVRDEEDTRADAVAEVPGNLISGCGTARILWKEAGTGVKWAIVLLGNVAGSVLVKITGAAVGGGKYTGTLWAPPASDVASTGNLAEAELGTAGSACLVLNVREVGKATHDLSSSGYLPLIFPGVWLRTNSDGTPVVAIDGYQWEDCT